MNSKKFSEAMSELDSKYVDEAISYKKKAKKPVWAKWGAIAACFVAVTVLGVGLFQNIHQAAERISVTREYTPVADRIAYNNAYQVYQALYPQLKSVFALQ